MSSTHDATFYVQIEPSISGGTHYSTPSVRSLHAVRITQKRPLRPVGGSVMVKLTIRLPDAAFLALQPEAVVVIPEWLIEGVPVEVEAVEP